MKPSNLEIEMNKFANSTRRIGAVMSIIGLFSAPILLVLMPSFSDMLLIFSGSMIYFGIIFMVIGDLLWRRILKHGKLERRLYYHALTFSVSSFIEKKNQLFKMLK